MSMLQFGSSNKKKALPIKKSSEFVINKRITGQSSDFGKMKPRNMSYCVRNIQKKSTIEINKANVNKINSKNLASNGIN